MVCCNCNIRCSNSITELQDVLYYKIGKGKHILTKTMAEKRHVIELYLALTPVLFITINRFDYVVVIWPDLPQVVACPVMLIKKIFG